MIADLTLEQIAEIDRRFDHHTPDGKKIKVHEALRKEAKIFAYMIRARTPEGREQSLAVTHLEEALFWANAAVARNG